MNIKILCVFLCFSIFASSASNLDYYWKDYDNVAPDDAFVAIENLDGTPNAYVGQAFILDRGIFPGTLFLNSTSVAITERQINSVVSSHLKILATCSPGLFKWIKTTYSGIDRLKQIDFIKLIEGGVENAKVLYIGRHEHEGKMQIGKVYSEEGVALPNVNGNGSSYSEFEILVFVSLI